MKTYTTKSNAIRAAKAAGFSKDQVEIIEQNGQFAWQEIDDGSSVYGFETHGLLCCPHCGTHLPNGVGTHQDEVNGKIKTFTKNKEFWCMGCEGEFGPDLRKQEKVAKAPAKQHRPILHSSEIANPCKTVWAIAVEMFNANPNVKRAEVLRVCVERGIAYYTARTQYQAFLGIRKEEAAREAASTGK